MPDRLAYLLNSRALLHIAREACERSRSTSLDAIVSLVFSAFYVEAATNELLHQVMRMRADDLKEIASFRRLHTLALAARLEERTTPYEVKLQVISAGLREELLDKGHQPYQDVDLLLSLRNAVAHNRPETLKLREMEPGDPSVPQAELDQLYQRLISRRVVPKPDPFTITPLFAALTQRQVAVWSINAALELVEALANALPSKSWRDQFFLGHDFVRVEL